MVITTRSLQLVVAVQWMEVNICLTANNEVPLRDFEFELTPPKLVKITLSKNYNYSTTAGTGAETEISAMVTYLKEGMKFCMWHSDVRPSVSLN